MAKRRPHVSRTSRWNWQNDRWATTRWRPCHGRPATQVVIMASRWELKTWKVTLDGSPEDSATKHGGILNLVLGCFRCISRIHTAYICQDSSIFTWTYWWMVVKLCACRNQWLMLMQWYCQIMVIVNAGYRDVDGQNQTNPERQSTWPNIKEQLKSLKKSKRIQCSNTKNEAIVYWTFTIYLHGSHLNYPGACRQIVSGDKYVGYLQNGGRHMRLWDMKVWY